MGYIWRYTHGILILFQIPNSIENSLYLNVSMYIAQISICFEDEGVIIRIKVRSYFLPHMKPKSILFDHLRNTDINLLDNEERSCKVWVWVFLNWWSDSLPFSSFSDNNNFVYPIFKPWHLITKPRRHYQRGGGYKGLWYQWKEKQRKKYH